MHILSSAVSSLVEMESKTQISCIEISWKFGSLLALIVSERTWEFPLFAQDFHDFPP